MAAKRVNVMLDEETEKRLEYLQGVWNVRRSGGLRRAVEVAFKLTWGSQHRSAPEPSPEPTVVVEARPAIPPMMTARQLYQQQQRAREARRGDETDQRGTDEDI